MEAVNKISSDEFEKLKAAAKPLQDYLLQNWHVHCTAVVSITRIEVFEAQIFVPTMETTGGKE